VVVPIDAVLVFDHLSIVEIPPPITITDMGNVPNGRVSSGYGLTQFYYLAHDASLNAKRATCQNDRPPSVDEWIFYPDDGTAILDLTLLDC
jgi:hypothetical protein